ncbi:hypothetical protein ACIPLC_27545 [Kitasatospora sp. NPDC086801]|uniref:hypothetical protein n=1 Tax=Kitasatospora sp. NPDC086801 TaxID=3364066 RepID=UPI00380515DA
MRHRLGDELVTSIEVDQTVGARARRTLHSLGYTPTLIVGDGLEERQAGAEFDRIVATCSVRTVPYPWLWQIRPGGTITTCLGGWMQASGLVHLTLQADGSAAGRFTGEETSFVLAGPHQSPPRSAFTMHSGITRPTSLDPKHLWSWVGRFLARLAAPSAELLGAGEQVILLDTATGSQAWTEASGAGWAVHQHGPLPLWDAVERAFERWEKAGRPGQDEFGLTVSGEDQRVWIGDPSGPSWLLPG